MSKFELTVSPDYVRDWSVSDAIRELFQNAIDQEVILADNKMFFNYDEVDGIISIGNKESILEPKSLLLGSSTKADNDNAIGKFGEGYKIATLVLLRNNKTITFYNYGAKEVWKPRFVNSRRYGTKILTFEVTKNHFWNRVPDNNLTIVIEGITTDEYQEIKSKNLYLQDKEYLEGKNVIHTAYGSILMDSKYSSKIFVNGLYVSSNYGFKYGYSIKPNFLSLDRDRKLIPDYDLNKITREMWNKSDRYDLLNEMVKENRPDISGIGYIGGNAKLRNKMHDKFKEEHGSNAVPVTYTFEIDNLQKGYKPIIVSDTYKFLITGSDDYTEPEKIPTPKEKLEEWVDRHMDVLRQSIDIEEIDRLLEIIDLL